MKYQANPVIVEAHEIVSVGPISFEPRGPAEDLVSDGSRHLALRNGENVVATAEMLARMTPEPGDFWVIQSDGYIYLNPKAVFERKYSLVQGA